jgi:hypothetical protein
MKRGISPRPIRGNGFALVASLMMMVLLVILGVGLLTLSAIELRKAGNEENQAIARANARLALLLALNQLQVELGPDQRVSAPAALVTDAKQPHWTGVWSSRHEDGASLWVRDPATGSLRDRRNEGAWEAKKQARAWLVSGNGDPSVVPVNSLELVGTASAGDQPEARVRVPMLDVAGGAAPGGRLAWWTGDLGQRANLAVADVHADRQPDPDSPANGGYYRLLASQQADAAVMAEPLDLAPPARAKLASAATLTLAKEAAWTRAHFHDFTVHSAGVLADPREGGLKRDLTAFFASNGRLAAAGPLAGLSDDESLLATAQGSRLALAGPRFGVLRDWVRKAPGFAGRNVASVVPPVDASGGRRSKEFGFCNELPVKLKGAAGASLQPVLVEASAFMQISVFIDRKERTTNGEVPIFQMRQHNYPRVVLWNPYNVELTMQPAIMMIQGNGRQEVWTKDALYDNTGRETGGTRDTQWLFFEGGRSTSFGGSITESAGYNDPYMGSYYYSVPQTSFAPGECLVFSPKKSAEYDGLSAYRPGAYDLSKNELSCEVAPHVSRSYYVSAADIGGGMKFRPFSFWFDVTPGWSRDGRMGIENQSDDTRVVMKALTGTGPVTFERFDALPQLAYVSGSLQYGAGREPRIAWNRKDPMTVELLDKARPVPTVEPNVRTRDGLRLRWFTEHTSNRLNAGALANSTRFFEEALLATWNPRAGYAVRSPWENLGGSLPTTGSAGGPWFFGAYTRDLYDGAVSWTGQVPRFSQGRNHGNPFGPPQEGQDRHVAFELPRAETGVLSLGQLQHAKLSEFVWHPSFAIGNSLADPRLGLTGLDRTVPASPSTAEDKLAGFHRNAIGWSNDTQRAKGRDEWADTGRAMLQGLPDSNQVVYDLSFEANHALWDRYFLSTGDAAAKAAFLTDPQARPLPNGRMRLAAGVAAPADPAVLADFHRTAYHLMVAGAFNVNSTRVEAWKAMLAATRALGPETTAFPRLVKAAADPLGAGDSVKSDEAWAGNRTLSDEEIGRLAEAIVAEVKLRGPFLSLADFVNRRLRNDPTGHCGALQAAIDRAGLNAVFETEYPLDNEQSLRDYKHPDNIADSTRLEQTLKPSTVAWGAPGFLTQGDLLQVLGPVVSARSDSFVIRAYGEATGPRGKVLARAWCEAVVQRTPEPVTADASGINPAKAGLDGDFGRRFAVSSFRWLRPEEI